MKWLTGVQSIAWPALIIANVFEGTLKGQFNISEEEKKVKMAFLMSFNWAQFPSEDKKQLLSTEPRGQLTIVSSSKLS